MDRSVNTTKDYEFFSNKLLKEIREKFYYVDRCPYVGPRISLDSCSGSLRLKEMANKVKEETALPSQFKNNAAGKHFEEVMENAKEDLKLFFGARSGQIIRGMSSTHNVSRIVEAIISSLSIRSNVVTTNLEHPSICDSTKYFASKHGIEWRLVSFSPQTGAVSKEAVLEKIDKNTGLLAIIHASNVTGAINDLAEIVKEVRKINPEIYIVTDGVQYAPYSPLDVEKLKIDAYSISCYKLFCNKGVSFAYLSDRASKLPHFKVRWKEENNWDLGSINHIPFAAFSTLIDYLCWLGSNFTDSLDRRIQIITAMKRIKLHSKALLHRFLYGNNNIDGLLNMEHINLYGIEGDLKNRNCTMIFNIKGIKLKDALEYYISKNKIIISSRTSYKDTQLLGVLKIDEVLRLSTSHYNSPEEVDSFLNATSLIK